MTALEGARSRHVSLVDRERVALGSLTRSHRDHINAVSDVRKAYRDIDQDTDTFFKRLSRGMSKLGKETERTVAGLTPLGRVGLPVLGVLADAAIEVARVVAEAAKAVWLLPAAAAAAGAGIGTLALATSGFSNVIDDLAKGDLEKFAKDIQGLSPNAQQAALSIQAMMPAFTELRKATQDAFFKDIPQVIEGLTAKYLPSIQQLTTGIASSFNQMMTNVGAMLMTPAATADLQRIFDNIGLTFTELVPAAQSLAQAILDIATVGSDFFPGWLLVSRTWQPRSRHSFRDKRNSGELRQWIQGGITAVKELADAIWSLGKLIYDVFDKDGGKATTKFKNDVKSMQ